MIEIIFFDVDGTLMDHHGFKVPSSTIQTLKLLKAKGHKLCIATGRSYDSLLRTPIINYIDWDGMICNNGQLVLNEHQDILFKAVFKKEVVEQFLKTAKRLNFPVVVKCKKRFISQKADQNTMDVHAYFNNPIPPVDTYTNQEVEAMNIYAPKSYDYQDFKDIPDIHIIPCDLNYGEVSVKGVSKATSIQYLLDYYHFSSYIAFGDSPNDIEMLKHAKISVAMGQSQQHVKTHATFVTKPLNEDGIEYACKMLNLI